jgi:hypothetical protein
MGRDVQGEANKPGVVTASRILTSPRGSCSMIGHHLAIRRDGCCDLGDYLSINFLRDPTSRSVHELANFRCAFRETDSRGWMLLIVINAVDLLVSLLAGLKTSSIVTRADSTASNGYSPGQCYRWPHRLHSDSQVLGSPSG